MSRCLIAALVVLDLLVGSTVGLIAEDGDGNDPRAACEAACAGNTTCLTDVRTAQCSYLCDLTASCWTFCCNNTGSDRELVAASISPLVLHCRSSNILSVRWFPANDDNGSSKLTYLVELSAEENEEKPTELEVIDSVKTTKTMASFYNLTENSKYRIRLSSSFPGEPSRPIVNGRYSTLPDNFEPKPVPNLRLEKLVFRGDVFIAVVSWDPSDDQSCFYNIVAWDLDLDSGDYFKQIEIREPETLMYAAILPNLNYSSNYSVKIQSLNPGNPFGKRESDNTWCYVDTPSCLETHYNLNICAPPPPMNLQVKEFVPEVPDSNVMLYDIIVSWDEPELQPDSYIITLYSQTNESVGIVRNITGNITTVRFLDANVGISYHVTLVAVSPAGKSAPAFVDREITPEMLQALFHPIPEYSAFGWAIGGTILLTIVVALSMRIRRKTIVYRKRRKYFQDLEQKAPKHIDSIQSINVMIQDDPLEIIPDGLVLMEVLGEGAFGVVRRALLQPGGMQAAVKTLKDTTSAEDMKQFKAEIDMMKSVSAHPHLVSLIGCCTRPSATMMLIVEYCERGDLQNYLRMARERMTTSTKKATEEDKTSPSEAKLRYAELRSDSFMSNLPNLIINKLYDIDNNIHNEPELTATDLLSFARQIAIGMEFLATNRIVHRDLAARNVLVCADKTVKIADFGMSRDIYQENVYKRTGSGKLPFKWMALEALTHQVYTIQSDVWSYGVLLWEIVTLGGMPYPSIPTGRLLKLLLSGYRMERPLNCSQDVYQMMLSCWNSRPRDRPTFTELKLQLEIMLANKSDNAYLELDVFDHKDIEDFKKISSDQSIRKDTKISESDRYLKPTPKLHPLNTNVYSHLPTQPPPYPAPMAAMALEASLKLSQSYNNNIPSCDTTLCT